MPSDALEMQHFLKDFATNSAGMLVHEDETQLQQEEVVHALFCLMPSALDRGPRSGDCTAQTVGP